MAKTFDVTMDFYREVWEGWTPKDFIDEIRGVLDEIMGSQTSRRKPRTRSALIRTIVDLQPYYKRRIREVEDYFFQEIWFLKEASMETGKLYCTAGINKATIDDYNFSKEIAACFGRYLSRDWGDICAEDKELNDTADERHDRILAMYNTSHGRICIITERDKSATTVLFHSEY